MPQFNTLIYRAISLDGPKNFRSSSGDRACRKDRDSHVTPGRRARLPAQRLANFASTLPANGYFCRTATHSTSTRAPNARPLTPAAVRAGKRSVKNAR